MKRLRIAVLYGGRSTEREVSRLSARTILGALDRSKYDAIPLAVGEDGRFLDSRESALLLTGAAVSSEVEKQFRPTLPVELEPEHVDVVFPIIHGTMGEDGSLQGFLDCLGVPYVGAGVTASAIGMDKTVFKRLLRGEGLPIARWIPLRRQDRERALERIPLPLPVFVKPSNGGSSVGVTKVKVASELPAAIDAALLFDDRILVEEAINGRELECAVLGGEELKASSVGEVVPGREFYDYADKYQDGKAKLLIPAPIPNELCAEVQRLAVAVCEICEIWGMARVDFFLERGTNRILINELNSLPGFTSMSMYPLLWGASGLSLAALIDELIRLALERSDCQARLEAARKPPAPLA